jgi:HEPN domain-containing protein
MAVRKEGEAQLKYIGIEAAAEWIALANGDYEAAQLLLPTKPYLACYHSQQAAEKALKAIYVAYGIPFSFVHAIGELMDGLSDRHPQLLQLRRYAAILTLYEANSRYINVSTGINPMKEFTEENGREAIQMAREILQLCEAIFATLARQERSDQSDQEI